MVLTDGRATVAARPGNDPVRDACRAAGLLAADGIATVVVDCEAGPVRLGLAARVAAAAGAPLVALADLSADRVAGVVHAARAACTERTAVPQGQPVAVPADGLTTRQRRNRPLLVVHTGEMKGKSTAAFGLALRGWAQGWSIGVFQFVKSAKWRVGEETAFRALGALHERDRRGRPRRVAQDGRGLVVDPQAGHRRRPRRQGTGGLDARSGAGSRRRPTTSTCSTSSPTR